MVKKVLSQSALLFAFLIMFMMPFQTHAETTVPEGFYIVKGQEGAYYSIDDLFQADTKQHVIDLINDVGLDRVYIVSDGRIANLNDFVFHKLQGVPVTADTMPRVSFVDRLGRVVFAPSTVTVPTVIASSGVYGPSEGKEIIQGNVTVNSSGVTLRNVHITGNLTIGEDVGQGEVTLQGVTVDGQTIVKGGGENSVYFRDSVLMTVIVNKNDGKVRIVAEGATKVVDLQLESYAIVKEMGLTGDSPGFTNVIVRETVQSSDPNVQLELAGSFETVNSRAANVRIHLTDETSIETLVLHAIAAITGNGAIDTATIRAEDVQLSTRPSNLVLQINGSVRIGNEIVSESYSSTGQATLQAIRATQGMIQVHLSSYLAGLTIEDFSITAKLNGMPIQLENLEYDQYRGRIMYEPIPLTPDNMNKILEITVAPSAQTSKLSGTPKTTTVLLQTGFEGYITDVYGAGIEGITIKFRRGTDARTGAVVKEVTTDQHGYYSVALDPGTYTGEISGAGFVTTYMIAVAPTDSYNTNQNETAIRAAGTSELKVMLTWNEKPRDVDSHLVGPTPDGGKFHTWFADKIYVYNGIIYVDLDWDDTQSYGPETTTVRKLVDGTYTFIVHNYSEEHPLTLSGSKVQVFTGNATAANYEFTVPTNGTMEDLYWTVFEMVVSNNGQNISIRPINTLSRDIPTVLREAGYTGGDRWDIRERLSELVTEIGQYLNEHPELAQSNETITLRNWLTTAESMLTNPDATEEDLSQTYDYLYNEWLPFLNAQD
ncbi:hypothetical protein [Anoxybacillus sp. MB8]|uniref:hypothetical protein n=1 Tax=Anoxybacillus sp. MB8 TaxID=2496850 RepID=UPI0013D1747B|nr:hypothetical protein [Anoxybacillus sp. MB8]